MSTARLFKIPEQPREEVERQRDLLQIRNAELVLTLQEVQAWLNKTAFAGPKIDRIRKKIDGALATQVRNVGQEWKEVLK